MVPRLAGRLLGRVPEADPDAFWALHDVTLEVRPGEVLGVIGPNGAGKSTILKLATGILRPDRGRVEVHGRVGALIELAAGFHGELTGRENVYFQGAVMGLPRSTITERFDEIVGFAGVESFIDTPVKRYSSGMSARLGFSIAVHMDPDVLLVDEVLAVGDREFQARAVERLEEIVARDIPVVVVSHQLERVLQLADRGILMSGGRVHAAGEIADVVAAYVDGVHLGTEGRPVDDAVRLDGFCAPLPGEVDSGASVTMEVAGEIRPGAPADRITVGVLLRALPEETTVFATHNLKCGVELPASGPFRIAFELDMSVGSGLYRAQAFVWDPVDERETVRAASEVIRVRDDGRIFGRVHLNPRARSLPAGPAPIPPGG